MLHIPDLAVCVKKGVFAVRFPVYVVFSLFNPAVLIIGDVFAFEGIILEGTFFSELPVFIVGKGFTLSATVYEMHSGVDLAIAEIGRVFALKFSIEGRPSFPDPAVLVTGYIFFYFSLARPHGIYPQIM
jgi:hypothetical protein